MRFVKQVGLFACLTFTLLGSSHALAHPQHVSIAEAQWNAKTGKLEVAVKVHPNDLERSLRRRFSRRVILETTANVDRLIEKYLATGFVVKQQDGRPATLKWVGKEISVKAGWLYFEVPLKRGPLGTTFTNRLFFELLDDQVNTINVKVGPRRKSLNFTHERPTKKLELESK